jgi:hypothetical protein
MVLGSLEKQSSKRKIKEHHYESFIVTNEKANLNVHVSQVSNEFSIEAKSGTGEYCLHYITFL